MFVSVAVINGFPGKQLQKSQKSAQNAKALIGMCRERVRKNNMNKKEVGSIKELIEKFLLTNKNKFQFTHKKGYRTHSINNKELLIKIQRTRIFLKSVKIKKGDKIIILGNNSIDWISVYFACILSGIVVVPLDTLTDKLLLKRIQKQIRAKAIFLDKGLASIKIKKYYLDEFDNLIRNIKIKNIQKVKINPNDILEIVYTSGTTDEPKGVILANKNIICAVNSAINSVPLKIRLKIIHLLPLSHIFGQVYGLFLPMYFKHKIFFIDSIQPNKIISFIKNQGINCAILVPGILATLKKELEGKNVLLNLGIQFRLIGVGGAPLDIKLEKWWRAHLITVIQGYGLTETASVVSTNRIGISKPSSVGKIAENIEVKLGEDNEILVKGKNVTPGYYNDKEKTKQSFEGSWFKTGDIGEIKNGYLYVKGRKKDVIITGSGLKTYPIDVENILNKVNGVEESCVLENDGKIHATLILNKRVSVAKIINSTNEKLMTHQKITSYSVWPYINFPKTQIGKIKKFIVLEEINKLKNISYSYKNKLFKIIGNVLKPHQKIKSNSKLSDLGMDSLKRVELVSEFEKEFGIEIDELKINQYTKIANLNKIMKESHVHKIRPKKWTINPISKIIRFIFQQFLIFPVIRIFTKTHYYGLENIKNIEEQVIFASNHQSSFDAPVIIKKLGTKIVVAADSDYVMGIGTKGSILFKFYRIFKGYLVGLFFNAYPFGETIGIKTSLEFTGEMIDRGYSILIFPEAHRTKDGKIKSFKSGIGYLALNMDVPIIPIKIQGLFEILPIGTFIPKFGKSIVKIGKPIIIKNLSYMEAAKLIEKRIKEL